LIPVDTSGLLAAIDSSQRFHRACADALAAATPPLLLSPFVLAELDYLLLTQVHAEAEWSLLAEVDRGVYRLEPFDRADVQAALAVLRQYREHAVGLADASLVVLAGRHRARDVLTLDRKHFGVLRRPNGRPFRILPG
jgi:hypothetical protein